MSLRVSDLRGEQGGLDLLAYELAVPKRSICYLSWMIDAYEGVGFLRTDDQTRGLVSVLFPSVRRDELERLLEAFESEGIPIERLGVRAETSDTAGFKRERGENLNMEDY